MWETGKPWAELIRIIEEGTIKPQTILELGCGSGADAVYLAKRRFEVTAVDSSPLALEMAHSRAEQENALVRLVLDDVFNFCKSVEPFDLVYDAGFYHFIRQANLDQFLDLLWGITKPGSYYLTLAGNADDTSDGGPPRVTEQEIRSELGRLLEVVHLRPFRFEGTNDEDGYLGWSCLMRRPLPVKTS